MIKKTVIVEGVHCPQHPSADIESNYYEEAPAGIIEDSYVLMSCTNVGCPNVTVGRGRYEVSARLAAMDLWRGRYGKKTS